MIRLSKGVATLGLSSVVCRSSTLHCSETGSLLLAEVIEEPAGCPGQINPPQPTLSPPLKEDSPSHSCSLGEQVPQCLV